MAIVAIRIPDDAVIKIKRRAANLSLAVTLTDKELLREYAQFLINHTAADTDYISDFVDFKLS